VHEKRRFGFAFRGAQGV